MEFSKEGRLQIVMKQIKSFHDQIGGSITNGRGTTKH